MTEHRSDVAVEPAVRLGRRHLQVAVACLVAVDLLTTANYVARVGTERLFQQGGRLVLLLILAYFLLQGKAWARWLFVLLLLGGFLVVLVSLVRLGPSARMNVAGGAFLFAMCATYGIIGGALIFSRNVRAFFRAHRNAQAFSSHAA